MVFTLRVKHNVLQVRGEIQRKGDDEGRRKIRICPSGVQPYFFCTIPLKKMLRRTREGHTAEQQNTNYSILILAQKEKHTVCNGVT